MIYIGELDLLTDKDYENLSKEMPDKLLLFAKKNAVIPVSRVMSFNTLAIKMNKLEIVETEDSDMKAYYIGKMSAEDDVKLITAVSVSNEVLAKVNPQTKKERATRGRTKSATKATARKKENVVESKDEPEKEPVLKPSEPAKAEKVSLSNKPVETAPKKQIEKNPAEEKVAEPIAESNDENVKTFIKQMSVRNVDLNDFTRSNEELAKEIAELLKNQSEGVSDLLSILEDEFSKADAKTIYNWIHPNIKKLTELAKMIV